MKRIENLLILAAFTAVLLGNGKEPELVVPDAQAPLHAGAPDLRQASRNVEESIPGAVELVARR